MNTWPDQAKDQRSRYMRGAALASVALGLTLTLAKGAVWLLTGSVTMLASLADSTLDLSASAITYFGVRTALKPPDADHRFGHSKAEGLAALAQGAIMLGSAAFLLLQSISRILSPRPVEMAWTAIAVSLLAILLTFALLAFQRFVVRRTGSLAIRADSLHYAGDFFLNLAVIAGIAIAAYGHVPWADGVFGAVITMFVALQAWRVGRSAVDMLMDKELSGEMRETIFNVAHGNRQVRGIHDLKTRGAGIRDFIQFHIEVDPHLSLKQAHLVALEVEAALSEVFPDADIIIYVDPAGFERPNLTVEELARGAGHDIESGVDPCERL